MLPGSPTTLHTSSRVTGLPCTAPAYPVAPSPSACRVSGLPYSSRCAAKSDGLPGTAPGYAARSQHLVITTTTSPPARPPVHSPTGNGAARPLTRILILPTLRSLGTPTPLQRLPLADCSWSAAARLTSLPTPSTVRPRLPGFVGHFPFSAKFTCSRSPSPGNKRKNSTPAKSTSLPCTTHAAPKIACRVPSLLTLHLFPSAPKSGSLPGTPV